MSAFIGSQLSQTFDEIEKQEKRGKMNTDAFNLNILIPKIPEIFLDNTDRNRTSPFAFTGNKFEFRAIGSSANCANPMIALNAIVTDQLNRFKKDVDKLIAKNTKKDEAIFQVIKRYISESKKIRFEGNNYSEDWEKEAEKRGLSNIRATPAALRGLISKDAVRIFTEQEILSERELKARYEIQMENYSKKVQIESRVVGDLAKNHIIPIAIRYQNTLIENVRGLKDVLDSKTFVKLSRNQMQTIKEISGHVEGIKDKVAEMLEERKKANRIEDLEDQALAYNLKVFPYLAEIREHVDKLELMVDDELWPLPKYREMLFIK